MGQWTRVTLGLLLLSLFGLILIFSPKDLDGQDTPNPAEDAAPPANKIAQKMGGVHLVESRSGTRDWELFASAAEGYEGKQVWALTDIKVVFYAENNVTFTVTGNTGNIEIDTKNMDIKGNVQMNSSNGYKFRSDSMTYNAGTRMIVAPTTVKMLGPSKTSAPDMQVDGDRMTTNLADNRMLVEGHVKTQKLVDEKQMMILSEVAEFSGVDNSARFKGNVEIEVNSMKIVGPEAEFRYGKKSSLDSVFVNGGVKVSDVDKWATSENVSVDFIGNQFVFRGAPRVVQNQDELVGEEIVFLDGGKRVRVKGAKAQVDESRLKEDEK